MSITEEDAITITQIAIKILESRNNEFDSEGEHYSLISQLSKTSQEMELIVRNKSISAGSVGSTTGSCETEARDIIPKVHNYGPSASMESQLSIAGYSSSIQGGAHDSAPIRDSSNSEQQLDTECTSQDGDAINPDRSISYIETFSKSNPQLLESITESLPILLREKGMGLKEPLFLIPAPAKRRPGRPPINRRGSGIRPTSQLLASTLSPQSGPMDGPLPPEIPYAKKPTNSITSTPPRAVAPMGASKSLQATPDMHRKDTGANRSPDVLHRNAKAGALHALKALEVFENLEDIPRQTSIVPMKRDAIAPSGSNGSPNSMAKQRTMTLPNNLPTVFLNASSPYTSAFPIHPSRVVVKSIVTPIHQSPLHSKEPRASPNVPVQPPNVSCTPDTPMRFLPSYPAQFLEQRQGAAPSNVQSTATPEPARSSPAHQMELSGVGGKRLRLEDMSTLNDAQVGHFRGTNSLKIASEGERKAFAALVQSSVQSPSVSDALPLMEYGNDFEQPKRKNVAPPTVPNDSSFVSTVLQRLSSSYSTEKASASRPSSVETATSSNPIWKRESVLPDLLFNKTSVQHSKRLENAQEYNVVSGLDVRSSMIFPPKTLEKLQNPSQINKPSATADDLSSATKQTLASVVSQIASNSDETLMRPQLWKTNNGVPDTATNNVQRATVIHPIARANVLPAPESAVQTKPYEIMSADRAPPVSTISNVVPSRSSSEMPSRLAIESKRHVCDEVSLLDPLCSVAADGTLSNLWQYLKASPIVPYIQPVSVPVRIAASAIKLILNQKKESVTSIRSSYNTPSRKRPYRSSSNSMSPFSNAIPRSNISERPNAIASPVANVPNSSIVPEVGTDLLMTSPRPFIPHDPGLRNAYSYDRDLSSARSFQALTDTVKKERESMSSSPFGQLSEQGPFLPLGSPRERVNGHFVSNILPESHPTLNSEGPRLPEKDQFGLFDLPSGRSVFSPDRFRVWDQDIVDVPIHKQ